MSNHWYNATLKFCTLTWNEEGYFSECGQNKNYQGNYACPLECGARLAQERINMNLEPCDYTNTSLTKQGRSFPKVNLFFFFHFVMTASENKSLQSCPGCKMEGDNCILGLLQSMTVKMGLTSPQFALLHTTPDTILNGAYFDHRRPQVTPLGNL